MNMETTKQYPVMPLKNTVLFPQQVIPIYVGREKSLKLIEDLPEDNKYLVVVAQQDESLASEDLPDAILRLYQLEKVKFTDRMIYTHKPLELANIKNPVKTA